MASWKDGAGQYTWGTYKKTVDYLANIYFVGGPGGGNSDYFNIPSSEMQALRDRNYGTGIHFWWEGSTLNITVNLMIITSRTDWNIIRNEYYRGNPSYNIYEFYANIQYQKTNGQWVELGEHLINRVNAGEPLYDRSGWDSRGSGYLWKTFSFTNIDTNIIKQFSVGLRGDNAEVNHWNYFPIEVVKLKEHTVTIRYRDRATNQEVSGSQTVKVVHGQTYSGQAKSVNNYTAEKASFSFTVNADMEYVVWYNKNVTYIRPWAIRKSGSWKSFKTVNSNMKRRVSSVFSNKSTEFDQTRAGETIPSSSLGNNPSVTQSSNYIRKNGSWKRQGKIGS